jgi:UDP:flavonoid glycosyltransferase YjiC (YdhE family)
MLFTPGTSNRAAANFFRIAVEAASRLGRRCLLLTRFADQVPSALPPSIRHEAYVPFSQLLPRCSAIVHHGGIGTCAQGLAAGIPQLTIPFGFDQPDNATRLWRLGVGRWIVPQAFTGEHAARVLAQLLGDPTVQTACGRRAAAVRELRAIDDTCDLLEEVAAWR